MLTTSTPSLLEFSSLPASPLPSLSPSIVHSPPCPIKTSRGKKNIPLAPIFKNTAVTPKISRKCSRADTPDDDSDDDQQCNSTLVDIVPKKRSGISVQRCLPALQDLVNLGTVKFPGKKAELTSLFKSGSASGMKFELDLSWFINIEGPIAKAIVCLKSTQINTANIYKYWLAICGCIKQVFEDTLTGFTVEAMGQIYAIVNYCFCEQLQDGPADCYLAALCLDPHKLQLYLHHAHADLWNRLCAQHDPS
ncbi:hypothetical protein F4604DRAFT_1940890 [Suillus subluteus]|nr:hypothetical protein F4604DRAFT_1940890 [Suillus subluteus]